MLDRMWHLVFITLEGMDPRSPQYQALDLNISHEVLAQMDKVLSDSECEKFFYRLRNPKPAVNAMNSCMKTKKSMKAPSRKKSMKSMKVVTKKAAVNTRATTTTTRQRPASTV